MLINLLNRIVNILKLTLSQDSWFELCSPGNAFYEVIYYLFYCPRLGELGVRHLISLSIVLGFETGWIYLRFFYMPFSYLASNFVNMENISVPSCVGVLLKWLYFLYGIIIIIIIMSLGIVVYIIGAFTLQMKVCRIERHLVELTSDKNSCFEKNMNDSYVWGGTKKNWIFFKKRRFIYILNKKHLIPFKILSIGGNTLVQSFFPLCEAYLELLKLDVVECLLRSCFHLLHGGKSLSFPCFFHCRE